MGARAAALCLLAAGCTSGRGVSLPEHPEPYFLVQSGPADEGAPRVFGPFGGDHAPTPLALSAGSTLQLVGIDEDALAARYPSYETTQRERLRLGPSTPGLSECVQEGLLHEEVELEVPLAEVSPVLLEWAPDARAWTSETELEVPLSLRFPVDVCDRGPRLNARIFADLDPSAQLWSIEKLEALDSDHLLATGGHGLAVVERGARLEGTSGVLRLEDLELPGGIPGASGEGWFIRSAAVVSNGWPLGPVVVVVALAVGLRHSSDRGGGALAVATRHPDGAWTWGRVLFQRLLPEPVASADSLSLESVWVDRAGRFAAVGHQLVVTGTSTLDSVQVTEMPRFRARAVLALHTPDLPHLVVGDAGAVFEGDLFSLVSAGSIRSVSEVRTEALYAAAYLPGAPDRVVVGTAAGRLFQRQGTRESAAWSLYPFGLSLSAGGCRGTATVCGRWAPRFPVTDLAGLEEPSGLLLLIPECTTAFFRPHRDACGSAVPMGVWEPPTSAEGLGPRVAAQLGERVYVSVGASAIYEIVQGAD